MLVTIFVNAQHALSQVFSTLIFGVGWLSKPVPRNQLRDMQ